jgi:glycine/D-amino acid oxidase-like deaminating enzyme
MVQTEFLVLGQGISGTWLTYWLKKAGRQFLVIDESDPTSSSRVAAGVINPVTGRRYAITWMADTLLPFAEKVYKQFGKELSITAISAKRIIDFFPSAQMRLAFIERIEETPYLKLPADENEFSRYVHFELGCGEISPSFTVHLKELLSSWREKISRDGFLRQEKFDPTLLEFSGDEIIYKDITARYIVYCDGYRGMDHPWFNKIPFAPNKGEAILAEIPDLPADAIYKKGLSIVPLGQQGLFWIGASYEWDYDHADPTPDFRNRTDDFLKDFLKMPYRIVDHQAAIRPASLERRPFVGLHPRHPNVGILNGMGTKGCSLAPYFAKQLCDLILEQKPVEPLADIKRFKNLLLLSG